MRYIDLRNYIPQPENKVTLIFKNGDTKDIMTVIRRMDAYCTEKRFMRKVSGLFKGYNDKDTCWRLWRFAVDNFEYEADKNHEKVKSANWLAFFRKADCKSYSIFICAVLKELGYSCFFRFVSFSNTDSTPTHVFPVCRLKNGELIYMDAVPFNTWGNDFRFNEESSYTYYTDIEAAKIQQKSAAVGRIQYNF